MEKRLPYPFSVAFDGGAIIYYKCKGEKDHKFVEKLGYTPKMDRDCSYHAKGLNGLSLSSYGDWGAFFPKDADGKSTEIFLEMFDKEIIKLWKFDTYVEVYVPLTNDKLIYNYCYEDEKGWEMYDEGASLWTACDDLFAKTRKKPKDVSELLERYQLEVKKDDENLGNK